MPDRGSMPFPIQLDVEFLDRLSEPVRDRKAKSVSEIIRTALERYNFDNVVVMHPAQVQVSVRLTGDIRRSLRKVSRAKHTSVGHLVRAAVESYLPELEALPAPEDKPPQSRRKRRVRSKAKPKPTAKAGARPRAAKKKRKR